MSWPYDQGPNRVGAYFELAHRYHPQSRPIVNDISPLNPSQGRSCRGYQRSGDEASENYGS